MVDEPANNSLDNISKQRQDPYNPCRHHGNLQKDHGMEYVSKHNRTNGDRKHQSRRQNAQYIATEGHDRA